MWDGGMAEPRDLRDLIKPSSDEKGDLYALRDALLGLLQDEEQAGAAEGSDHDSRSAGVEKLQLTWQGKSREVPPSLRLALLAALEAFAQGDGVTVVPADNELTTGEAAELLGVSRTYLVRLISQGKLDATQDGAGKHRRLHFEDVVAYRRAQKSLQREAARKHDVVSKELGLE